MTSQPSLAVVGPQVKAANLREFIAEAKAKPGSLTFAYGSVSGRLTGELMMQLTGAKVLPVPYKGASPAMIDIAGGRVDLAFASPPSSIPLIKSGKMRGLAIIGPHRLSSVPDVPTSVESGFPDFVVDAWYAIAAPANTPKEIVARLNAEIRQVVGSTAAKETFNSEGLEAKTNTPEEMAAFVRAEYQRWGDVVRNSGIQPE